MLINSAPVNSAPVNGSSEAAPNAITIGIFNTSLSLGVPASGAQIESYTLVVGEASSALDSIGTPSVHAVAPVAPTSSMDGVVTSVAQHVFGLLDRMAVLDQVDPQSQYGPAASEIVSIDDDTALIRLVDAISELLATDAAMPETAVLAAAVESLVAEGVARTQVTASVMLAAALVATDAATHADIALVLEAMIAGDTPDAVLQAYARALSGAVLAEQLTEARVAIVRLTSEAALEGDASPFQVLQASANSGLISHVQLAVDGEVFDGVAVNSRTLAPSLYEDYPFTSMASIGGKTFGASAKGLYELAGEDDAGDQISARFITGEVELGGPGVSRISKAVLGMTADGEMVLKVTAVHDGERQTYWYRAAETRSRHITEQPIKVGRGLTSRLWQFELANTQGDAFEFEGMTLDVLALNRRY